jgi:hypothetical protein
MHSEPSPTDLNSAVTAERKPSHFEPDNRAFSARTVCDLGESYSFTDMGSRPCVPILAAFGAERMHKYEMLGRWDLERAVSENIGALFRSVRKRLPVRDQKEWDDLTFQFGRRSFLAADATKISGFAGSPREAEELVTTFDKAYSRPEDPSGGSFYLIKTGREISIETVPLGMETILPGEAFC